MKNLIEGSEIDDYFLDDDETLIINILSRSQKRIYTKEYPQCMLYYQEPQLTCNLCSNYCSNNCDLLNIKECKYSNSVIMNFKAIPMGFVFLIGLLCLLIVQAVCKNWKPILESVWKVIRLLLVIIFVAIPMGIYNISR